jgi:hypothetical protein
MSTRRFTDEHGVVWDAITITGPTMPVAEAMAMGWTSFRSRTEVRRIVPARPIDDVSEAELRGLLATATSYGAPRRLIE